MKISIVIICYNEKKNLKTLIYQSKKLIKKFSNIEIIFVDNGSSDGSKKLLTKMLKSKFLKFVHVKKNKGYGYGIIKGLNTARGEIVGWTHGDDLSFFSKFKIILSHKLEKKNFFLKGFRIGKRPFLDTLFSYGFNITSSIMLRKKLWEITAHPTLFSKKLFKQYKKILPYDFSIDLYLYYLAKKNQYIIRRTNLPYKNRKHGVSKWNKNFLSKIDLMIKYVFKIFKLMYLDMFKIIK